ncbi:MAG: hypothetical protein OEW11_00110 [Nitrospirota bacterium]|nr:hypothetical protein [Nitrospirota bacterium]
MRARPFVLPATPETRSPRVRVRQLGIRATIRPLAFPMPVNGWISTLAVGGAYVEAPRHLPRDTEIRIDWMAQDKGRLVRLRLTGWVAYADERGMGIQFDRDSLPDPTELDGLVSSYLSAAG